MPENGSFQNLPTQPNVQSNYSFYNSSVWDTLKLYFIYKGLNVYKQGKFRTNTGNLNISKRTKQLNFKEILVDFGQNFGGRYHGNGKVNKRNNSHLFVFVKQLSLSASLNKIRVGA